ncbi:MAG: amino acid synthesis family protein [Alphaproteobacteria bacterium]|nr:amino acid synthesis family protein [Alphaproteobacteria bacterium]
MINGIWYYVEDLSEIFDLGRAAGDLLSDKIAAMLDGAPVSYGKAAIVGTDGQIEHGAACIHPKLGKPMRAATSGGKALIPSNCKFGAIGATVDVPLGDKDDIWSFPAFDTMTVTMPDAR